jgi:hypothetical protein
MYVQFEKRAISHFELLHLFGLIPCAFDGILANSQKVVEGNECQITYCFVDS